MSLGLLGAYVSGSETESESDQDQEVEPKTEPKYEPLEALSNPFGAGGAAAIIPKPSFMQEQQQRVAGVKCDNSVFSNPFR